jgi:hypothetical protein
MKKIIILSVTLAVLIGCGIRIYYVNSTAEKPVIEIYAKGENVEIGENFFDRKSNEIMDGYTVKVLDSRIVDADEYLKSLNIEQERSSFPYVEYFCEVKVAVENISNEFVGEQGINLINWRLQGDDYFYMLSMDDPVYDALNPSMKSEKSFSLRIGDTKEFTLPFDINMMYHDDITPEKFLENPPKLVICDYPVEKKLEIV